MQTRSTLSIVALASTLFLSPIGCRAPEEQPQQVAQQEAAPAPRVIEARTWTHEVSDLPVDPRIHFGAFDNGLRFAWARNAEPEERCYLRLHVNVGSLSEQESERGMAHFLEHMAFNGSTNFPAGTLVEWFQKHGMAFGADANAHTSFSETVYKLDLPQSDANSLREGLVVLRDFADGLHLNQEEIDNEKGVIDGEERERDSAGSRLQCKELDLVFEGTLVGKRLPLGKTSIRAAFTAERVRAFYERWYRPENMTLVAVGDLGELNPEALFAEYFENMPVPEAPLDVEPAPGTVSRYDRSYNLHEEEIPLVSVAVQRLRAWEDEPRNRENLIKNLPLGYARRMLNLRFSELAKKPGSPYLGAGVGSAASFEVIDGEKLSLQCQPEKWQEALAFCEQELRRAIEFGFREEELAEHKARAFRRLDEQVERESTQHSGAILGAILAAAEDDFVPMNAEAQRDLLRPAIEALTADVCSEAFREAWSKGELSVNMTGNVELGADAPEQLLAAYAAASAVAVERAEQVETPEYAYASNAQSPGEITSREHVEDLDFTMIRFANGVAVNIKRTEFKKNQVLVTAKLGEGGLTLEPEQEVLKWVAGRVLGGAGLAAHSSDDLRRLLAGRQVSLSLGLGDSSFGLGGATTDEDLLLQCELIVARIASPGWREDGLVQFRKSLPLFYESLNHQHQGPMMREFMPAIYSGDVRFALPTEDAAREIGMQQVQAWLEPELATGALEVSFVGDLDVEKTIAIAARTFGKLAPRKPWREFVERRQVPALQQGLRQQHTIDTDVPKALVVILFPMTDGLDPQTRRALQALNAVINDRLRLEVREKLGAAYSPGSGIQLSQTYPGVGTLMLQAMSNPAEVDRLVEACLAVTDSLAADGVGVEELDRLREPMLNSRRDAKRTNGYWMGVLDGAQKDPEHLDSVRSADAFLENVGPQDLNFLATEYLTQKRASILVVQPK